MRMKGSASTWKEVRPRYHADKTKRSDGGYMKLSEELVDANVKGLAKTPSYRDESNGFRPAERIAYSRYG